MSKDLNYKTTGNHSRLAVTGESDTPDLVKRAITLLLFSVDPEIRNFNGQSVVSAFSTIPQGGFSGINFYLTIAAGRIKSILSSIDARVSNVYFECIDNAPSLSITLNIQLEDDVLTSVIYSE